MSYVRGTVETPVERAVEIPAETASVGHVDGHTMVKSGASVV